jgi:hypothetical protein
MLFLLVGITLGIALLPPRHPLLASEVVIAHHLSAVDAGYCVVLYLWMLVRGLGFQGHVQMAC